MQGRMASIEPMGRWMRCCRVKRVSERPDFGRTRASTNSIPVTVRTSPVPSGALVEPALSLLPVVKRDGDDGPSVGPDIQRTPSADAMALPRWPTLDRTPYFRLVDEAGFEPVRSIA